MPGSCPLYDLTMSSFSVFSFRSTCTSVGGGYLLSVSGKRNDRPDLADVVGRLWVSCATDTPQLSFAVSKSVVPERTDAPGSVGEQLLPARVVEPSGGPLFAVAAPLALDDGVAGFSVVDSLFEAGSVRLNVVVSLLAALSVVDLPKSFAGFVLRIASCHRLAYASRSTPFSASSVFFS